MSVTASPRSDDAEFIRRIYLDLTGAIPPAGKAAAFLDGKDAKKREKLIGFKVQFGHDKNWAIE